MHIAYHILPNDFTFSSFTVLFMQPSSSFVNNNVNAKIIIKKTSEQCAEQPV